MRDLGKEEEGSMTTKWLHQVLACERGDGMSGILYGYNNERYVHHPQVWFHWSPIGMSWPVIYYCSSSLFMWQKKLICTSATYHISQHLPTRRWISLIVRGGSMSIMVHIFLGLVLISHRDTRNPRTFPSHTLNAHFSKLSLTSYLQRLFKVYPGQ